MMFKYSQKLSGYHVCRKEALPSTRGIRALPGWLLSVPAFAVLLLPTAYPQKKTPADTSVVVQPGAPGEPSKTLPPSTRPLVSHLSQADVTFMQCMIMHHSQAVEMTAMIPAHTGNKDVLSLGAKISSSQMDEINFMKRWLIARHQPASMAMPDIPGMDMSRQSIALMPGMLTVKQMEALRQAKDAEFDRLFLAGMIQHHKGALIMVKDLFNTPGTGQDAGQGSEHGTLSYRCDQGSSRDAAGGKGGIEPSRLH
jgi:uncharacterized protein (DUF305 family)